MGALGVVIGIAVLATIAYAQVGALFVRRHERDQPTIDLRTRRDPPE